MKLVILAGGLGTRLSEETTIRPKPMVEIGGRPILWHIMKIYSHYGINDFIVCLGYKGYLIKEYFSNYYLHASDVTIDILNDKVEMHRNTSEPWRITLIDTGAETMTGGRLKRVLPYLEDEESFCFTYGDGVSNVNIPALLDFHKKHGRLVTLTATRPTSRFGALDIADDGAVTQFTEKPPGEGRWVNGGYFVLSPKVGKYIADDAMPWERVPMETLAREGQVAAYKHDGFWQPMDTMHDKNLLEDLWRSGKRALEGLVAMPAIQFWAGKRVFLTGHTGFKGSWLSLWLQHLGAEVTGYALEPPTDPSLFRKADVACGMRSVIGDIRDAAHLAASMQSAQPEIVLHLAAQPLVRQSYADPVGTYQTNVLGTIHVLEAVRQTPSVRAIVVITTDKCYENKEWIWPYRETDPLGGYDPYSSSKACAEIVTAPGVTPFSIRRNTPSTSRHRLRARRQRDRRRRLGLRSPDRGHHARLL